MGGAEGVDLRKQRADAGGFGRKAFPAQKRVEPYEFARGQAKALSLAGQIFGAVPVQGRR